MKKYAIDVKDAETRRYRYVGITIPATRTSRAIAKAEQLLPGVALRVRLVTGPVCLPADMAEKVSERRLFGTIGAQPDQP